MESDVDETTPGDCARFTQDLIEQLEAALLATIDRRLSALHSESPRYTRWLAVHAVGDLLGRMLLSAGAIEGDAAQARIKDLVDRLAHVVGAAARPSETVDGPPLIVPPNWQRTH